jgi:uncharacterized coiled-coil protein SlyX
MRKPQNSLSMLAGVGLLIFIALGCGLTERLEQNTSTTANSNKTVTDRVLDTAVAEEKIGIAECDEVIEYLARQTDDPDDNLITKAAKRAFANRIRDELKRAIAEQKADETKLADTCRDLMRDLRSFGSENTNANQ